MCGWADQAQAQGQGLCIMDFQVEFRESYDAFQWYNDAPKGCILGSVVWELRACNHFHPLDFFSIIQGIVTRIVKKPLHLSGEMSDVRTEFN